LILILLIVIIISRFIAVGLISYLFASFKKQQVIFSSLAMISVGEFSLIIAQAANQLNLGVDFVSITASLILLTALIMSFSIGYFNKVSNIIDDNTPKMAWTDQPKSFSNYVKMLFNELDMENAQTKHFKDASARLMALLLVLLSVIIGWNRLFEMLLNSRLYSYIYLLHFAAALVVGIILFYLYINSKKIANTLITILSDFNSANVKRSRYVLNNLIIAMILFVVAIFSPIIIVTFGMPVWANLLPFLLLVVVVIRMKRAIKIITYFNRHAFY
jgi:hypothetical protein